MEQTVLRMLDSMITTTDDPELKDMLREHKLETESHATSMRSASTRTARRRRPCARRAASRGR